MARVIANDLHLILIHESDWIFLNEGEAQKTNKKTRVYVAVVDDVELVVHLWKTSRVILGGHTWVFEIPDCINKLTTLEKELGDEFEPVLASNLDTPNALNTLNKYFPTVVLRPEATFRLSTPTV